MGENLLKEKGGPERRVPTGYCGHWSLLPQEIRGSHQRGKISLQKSKTNRQGRSQQKKEEEIADRAEEGCDFGKVEERG